MSADLFDASGSLMPFLVALGVALILFAAVWPLSVIRRDASLADLLWGPGFLLNCGIAAIFADTVHGAGWLVLALVALWSGRIAVTLTGRRLREGREDPRYAAIRAAWGPTFWWKSLFVVFALQAFVQWLLSIGPMAGILAAPSSLGGVAVAGLSAALAGLALETLADVQLDRFKRRAPPGALMTSGLRAHVRHPNYTGEMIFWLGIAMIVADAGAWLGFLTPALIVVLLWKVSGAPILDERLAATRPGHAAYRARVPAFLPMPFGRGAGRARRG